MSSTILTSARIFAAGADLTGASNKVDLKTDVDVKDSTVYGSNGWQEQYPGLKSATYSAEGFWEAADLTKVDDSTWANLGSSVPFTVGPTAATVGSLAYIVRTTGDSYTFGGQVGELAPWKASGSSDWPVSRGSFVHPPGTARTSTGSGTGVQMVAVPAGARLYGALHVTSAAGTTPTLTVTVQSYTDNTFASPVTRLTFAQATGISSQILRTAGTAITDTWYRVAYTIGGGSPSFTFVAALGIA